MKPKENKSYKVNGKASDLSCSLFDVIGKQLKNRKSKTHFICKGAVDLHFTNELSSELCP